MIFGEDFGQLAASGEYEEYKSGTTVEQLNAAISALTYEEYLDSFIAVNTDMIIRDPMILRPIFAVDNDRLYELTLGWNSAPYLVVTGHYNNGNFNVRVKSLVTNPSVSYTIVDYSTNAGTLTLTSWKLYKRQKSYDVATSGSKAAQAIAPVQNSLATANKNYAVGEQFYYDGHLYKVTASISSGAQIVIGTNAELAGDVITQMKEVENVIITPTSYCSIETTLTKIEKSGNVVVGNVRLTTTQAISSDNVALAVLSIPPKTNIYPCGFNKDNITVKLSDNSNLSIKQPISLMILRDTGAIYPSFQQPIPNNTTILFSFAYVVD